MNASPRGRASITARITVIGDISVDLVMGPIDRWPDVGTETLMAQAQVMAEPQQ